MSGNHKKLSTLLFLAILALVSFSGMGQDTFSIVAIDSLTGEIGSAGASCVGSSVTYPHGAAILSDVIPGVGAIHTQAAWTPLNQQNAHNWMMMGLAPQQIIDSLVAHDANGTPSTRQYGITDYHGGHPRSAAYTGLNCSNYKNDTAYLNYSIQGNILLGQHILDSMQHRFLNTPGTLADRLMGALQGAKVIGADTRCAVRNTSSQSAFLRVAKMTDPADSLTLDLWMAYPQNMSGVFPVDPIDSLQNLYTTWKLTASVNPVPAAPKASILIYRDPSGNTVFDFTRCRDYLNARLTVFDLTGQQVFEGQVSSRIMNTEMPESYTNHILAYRLIRKNNTSAVSGTFIR